MTIRLVAVDHGVDLGQFGDLALTFLERNLTPVSEGLRRFYIDAGALAALEQQIDRSTAQGFEQTVRERFEAMPDTELRALVERELRPLPAELRTLERYQELRPSLELLFEDVPAQHRAPLIEASFERVDAGAALSGIPVNGRRDVLEAVYRTMPALGSDVSRTVRHNYTQLALAFLTSPVTLYGVGGHVPGFAPGHDPLFTPGQGYEPPREVIGKAVAATICDSALRALLVSTPEADFKPVFLSTFDEGYRRRLAQFFGDEYRATLRDVLAHHHLIGELDALLNRFGASDIVVLSGLATHALTVDLVGARNLVVRDLRSSDPYCVLELHDPALGQRQLYKSAVVKKSLAPQWNETWSAATTRGATLRLEILDRDRITSDDPMGHVELAVESLPEDAQHQHWYLLEGVAEGEVELRLTLRTLRPLYTDDGDPINSPSAARADIGEPGNVVEGEPPHADTPGLGDQETP